MERIKPFYETKIPWIFAFTKGSVKSCRSIDVAKLKNLIYGKKHLKTGSDTIFFLEHHHVEHQCATNWNRLWRLFVAFTTENWGQSRDTKRWVLRNFLQPIHLTSFRSPKFYPVDLMILGIRVQKKLYSKSTVTLGQVVEKVV